MHSEHRFKFSYFPSVLHLFFGVQWRGLKLEPQGSYQKLDH